MHRSRIDRVLFAISSRRLLIFSSSGCDDLGLPRHLRRDVHTFAYAHFARGRERGDRERAMSRFRACGQQGPGTQVWASGRICVWLVGPGAFWSQENAWNNMDVFWKLIYEEL